VRSEPPALLARADLGAPLPRLGGMARPDGVVIVSERYWAFAAVDGSVREGEMPRVPEQIAQVPLARGLARLWTAMSPLFRMKGVASARERILLAAALLAPFGLIFAPQPWGLIGALTVTIVVACFVFRGRTLRLHGAEHRAIAAAEESQLEATWAGAAHPSRFALRCGTNFAALSIPVAFAADRLMPIDAAFYTPLLASVLSIAVTMELWRVVQSARGWRRFFLAPGLALQRLTTREPRLEETRLALLAVASVVGRELDT
jgi:hypothetical protein